MTVNSNINNFKLKKLVLLFVIPICFSMVGCKATPTDLVIYASDIKEFQEMILIRSDDNTDFKYSEHICDQYLSKDGKVTFVIDADIITPEVSKLPVIKIKPSQITDEQVSWAIEEFMYGKDGFYPTFYMQTDDAKYLQMTLESQLRNEKELYEKHGSDARVERVKENLNKIIQYLDENYDKEKPYDTKIQSNFSFRPFEFYVNFDANYIENELKMTTMQLAERYESSSNLYLCYDVIMSEGKYARLGIYNEHMYNLATNNVQSIFGMEKFQIHVVYSDIPLNIHPTFILEPRPFSFYLPFGSLDMFYPDMTRSIEDSTNMAFDELHNLGVDNFYIESTKNEMGVDIKERYYQYTIDNNSHDIDFDEFCEMIESQSKFHKITFKPYYYGVPLLEANQAFYDGDMYYSPIEYEVISVRMSEEGIAEFKWTNPTDISNVLNDNVKIISLETAMENAKQFMTLTYNLPTILSISPEMPDYDTILKLCNKASVNISSIKLGLAGVPAYNSIDEYLLIPVWNFYGSYAIESDVEGYITGGTDTRLPFLSVNAIDGSIIHQAAWIEYN